MHNHNIIAENKFFIVLQIMKYLACTGTTCSALLLYGFINYYDIVPIAIVDHALYIVCMILCHS